MGQEPNLPVPASWPLPRLARRWRVEPWAYKKAHTTSRHSASSPHTAALHPAMKAFALRYFVRLQPSSASIAGQLHQCPKPGEAQQLKSGGMQCRYKGDSTDCQRGSRLWRRFRTEQILSQFGTPP
jgi:hypothetical protein